MQAAKKLVLVDEFDREYKHLRRLADKVAKTDQSLQLSDTLRGQSIAGDRKVREYVTALHTYLNVRKKVPAESEVQPILVSTHHRNTARARTTTDDNVDPGPHIEMEYVAFKVGQFRWRPQSLTL